MKEATGELNMTVVTLIAIAAIAALFYFAIWPMVQQMLVQQTCNTYGTNYKAVKGEVASTSGNATVNVWCCCSDGSKTCSESNANCIVVKSDEDKEEAATGD
jgi:hypothetical protein